MFENTKIGSQHTWKTRKYFFESTDGFKLGNQIKQNTFSKCYLNTATDQSNTQLVCS